MTFQIRRLLSKTITAALEQCSFSSSIDPVCISSNIQVSEGLSRYNFSLPWKHIQGSCSINYAEPIERKDYEDLLLSVAENMTKNTVIENAGPAFNKQGDPCLGIRVSVEKLWKSVVHPLIQGGDCFWRDRCMDNKETKNILVSTSFPCLGDIGNSSHIKSVIISNFISNINSALGHDVTKTCYIQDMNLDYGLFKYEYDMKRYDQDDMLRTGSMADIMNLYHLANYKMRSNGDIRNVAYEILLELEGGYQLDTWTKYRDIVIKDIEEFNRKIQCNFQHFIYNSSFKTKNIDKIINRLRENNIAEDTEDGRIVFVNKSGHRRMLIGPDGLATPLADTVARLMQDKKEKNYDLHYYVCPNTEVDDYETALEIISKLENQQTETTKLITHGQMRKLKTRQQRSKSSSYASYINELEDMLHKRLNDSGRHYRDCPVICSKNNVPSIIQAVLVIGDLKNKRNADYTFDFNDYTKVKLETGPALQHFHSQLHKKCGSSRQLVAADIDYSIFTESSAALNLLLHFAKFDEVISSCYEDLESMPLVEYLFKLKNLEDDLTNQSSRKKKLPQHETLVLLTATKCVLAEAMRVLGLEPLNEL